MGRFDGNPGSNVSGPESQHFRPDIQGLRAVAVLVVMAFHAGLPVPGGFAGVDIFFVISGFVVSGLLVRNGLSASGIRLGTFFARRFKRLIPALALLVTVVVIASLFILSPFGGQQTAAKTGFGAMLLLANAVIQRENGQYFSATAASNPLLNTWSLSVEEQFYLLVAPAAALAFALLIGYRKRRGAAVATVVLITAASLAATIAAEFVRIPFAPWWAFGFYSLLSRAWEFGLGALVAVVLSHRNGDSFGQGWCTRAAQFMSICGVLLIAGALWIFPTSPWPGLWTLAPTVGAALLLASGSRTYVGRLLSRRSAVAVGGASYSLYLWHWPFVAFALVLFPGTPWIPLLAVLVSVGPATLSYVKFETPLRYRDFGRRGLSVLILVALGVPIAASAFLLLAANSSFWPQPVPAIAASLSERSLANEFNCDVGPMGPAAVDGCSWGPALPGKPIYLVGDSHAAHLSDAVVAAGQFLRRPVYVATTSACPFLDVDVPRPEAAPVDNKTCHDFVQGSLDFLATAAKGTVVVGLAPGYPESRPGFEDDSAQVVDDFSDELESSVSRLQASGQEVVISLPVPQPPANWDPRSCSLPEVLGGRCTPTMEESSELTRTGPTREAIGTAAAATGAVTFDPFGVLCHQGECPTVTDGMLVYRDGSHLTKAGSLRLKDLVVAALLQAGSAATS